MGLSSDGKYYDSSGDPTKVYEVTESPDGDGWVVVWHTAHGTTNHIVKRLGKHETVKEADRELDAEAIQRGWSYYIRNSKDSFQPGYYETATDEPSVMPDVDAFDRTCDYA